MHTRTRSLVIAAFLAVGLLAVGGALLALADNGIPMGGFVADNGALNRDTSHNASAPSIAMGSPAQGALQPWVAFVDGDGSQDSVVVSAYVSATQQWQPRGGALNMNADADDPSLDFAGPNASVPYVAFSEVISGGQRQVYVRRFVGDTWAAVGQDNGDTPSLNRDTAQNANHPALADGHTEANADLLPWVAWDEETAGGATQVVVSRLMSETWQPVGDALHFDTARNASRPDMAFAGPNSTVPWVVWQESGGDRPTRLFAARAVTDTQAPGGFRWEVVGLQVDCGSDEAACAINLSADRDATDAHIAAGMLPGETEPTPWVVFTQPSESGAGQVIVVRLDPVSHDRFLPVGGSLNVAAASHAAHPDITVVGNTPHVVWAEAVGTVQQVYVRHLGDARPGQERWDLNEGLTGINRDAAASADHPAIASGGTAPFIAWQEGSAPVNVYAAHRYPEGPAWGSNRPPFIRVISGSFNYALVEHVPHASEGLLTVDMTTARIISPTMLATTSCDHVDGWEHITEIQYKLFNDNETAFLGRYVAAEDKFYVENAEPGPQQVIIETPFVLFHVDESRAIPHGPNSPALDVEWKITFKRPAFGQEYMQSINILYDNGQQTGFFQTGVVLVGKQLFLPMAVR